MTNLKTIFIALIALLTFTLISINATAQLHVVKPDGNVGIGTDTPQGFGDNDEPVKLDVKGGNTILRGRETILGSDTEANGTSLLSIGKGRTTDGFAAINLQPLAEKDAIGRLSSGINNEGVEYTSFQNAGNGFFSIRNFSNTAEIRFQTPGQNAERTGVTKFMIKPNGRVGIGTINPTALLHVNGGIKAVNGYKPGGGDWTVLSDKRTKKNINKYTKGLNDVLKLNPVMFNYNGKAGVSDIKTTYIGLIAQEFAEIEPNAISKYTHTDTLTKKTEEYMAMDASSIRYMLVNAVKELQSITELQRAEIVDLKETVAKLATNSSPVSTPGATEISVLLEGTGTENALLAQNIPNPFTTKTRIEYFIPTNSRNARMSFRDMTGKEIKRVELTNDGIGAIELSAKDLAAGIYSYVLYVNGSIVASKKMVLKQ